MKVLVSLTANLCRNPRIDYRSVDNHRSNLPRTTLATTFQAVPADYVERASYEVRHPEMAMLTRTDILVGVDEADDGVPSEFKICSLVHLSAIEPLGASSAESR